MINPPSSKKLFFLLYRDPKYHYSKISVGAGSIFTLYTRSDAFLSGYSKIFRVQISILIHQCFATPFISLYARILGIVKTFRTTDATFKDDSSWTLINLSYPPKSTLLNHFWDFRIEFEIFWYFLALATILWYGN